MGIFCCGVYWSSGDERIEDFRTLDLLETPLFSKRKIEIVTCPKCNHLRAELTQYNKQQKQWKNFKPKKKHTAEFIKAYESQPYIENLKNHIQNGTRENMNWLYQENGNIKDFNNTIRVKDYNKVLAAAG